MKPEEYLVLESRIMHERENISRLLDEMESLGLYPQLTATQVGGFEMHDHASARILGSMLQDFYTFLENIAKTVASRADKAVPTGDDWHREIINQVTLPVRGLRPAVFSRETAALLDPYRGFRHVFRNVYGFQLDSARLTDLVRDLPLVAKAVESDLHAFLLQMREAQGLANH